MDVPLRGCGAAMRVAKILIDIRRYSDCASDISLQKLYQRRYGV